MKKILQPSGRPVHQQSNFKSMTKEEKDDLENYTWILRRLEKDSPEEIVRILKLQKERKSTLTNK